MDQITRLINDILSENILNLRFKLTRRTIDRYINENQETMLVYAVKRGKIKVVKLLLSYGADVNKVDIFNKSPLYYAVVNHEDRLDVPYDKNITLLLLKHKADIKKQDDDGNTILHQIACYQEGDDFLQDVLNHGGYAAILIKNNRDESPCFLASLHGNIKKVCAFLTMHNEPKCDYFTLLYRAIDTQSIPTVEIIYINKDQITSASKLCQFDPKRNFLEDTNALLYALHYKAFNIDLLEYLLNDVIININACDRYGFNALHYAVQENLTNFVRILVEHGAALDARNSKMNTPLHYAAVIGNLDMFTILCLHGNQPLKLLRQRNYQNNTAFSIACKSENIDLMKFILRIYNMKANLWIEKDYIENFKDICSVLLKPCTWIEIEGGDPELIFITQRDAGFACPHKPHSELCMECIKYYIEKELDLNEVDADGDTLLHKASQKAQYVFAKELILQGANTSIKDYNGNTFLHMLIENRISHLFQLVLEHGASINIQNHYGKTPLHLALEYHFHFAVHMLLNSILFSLKDSVTIFGNLLITDVNGLISINEDTSTANKRDIAGYLYDTLSIVDNSGETVLHTAIKYYDGTEYSLRNIMQIVRIFPNINAQNSKKETPLIVAVKYGHTDIALLLIDHNYDASIVDQHGLNVFDYARSLTNHNILVKLVSFQRNASHLDVNNDTLIHYAARQNSLELIEIVLRHIHPSHIDFQNKQGDTALNLCLVGNTRIKIAQLLIDKGASLYKRNNSGDSPITLVIKSRDIHVIRWYYDVITKDNPSSREHECPVCFDIPITVFSCKRNHSVCGQCINKPNMEKCPVCREPTRHKWRRNYGREEEVLNNLCRYIQIHHRFWFTR